MADVAKKSTFQLKMSSDSGSTYDVIPGVTNFDIGGIAAEELDATDFDSTDGYREFVNGLQSSSDGSFVVNYEADDTTHQALNPAKGGAAQYFQAEYTAASRKVTFQALIKAISRPVEIGGIMKMTVTIKLTGPATDAALA